MANHISIDSQLSIFVVEVQLGDGDEPTHNINDIYRQGAIAGMIGDTPIRGENGVWTSTVDTAARLRDDRSATMAAFPVGALAYIAANGNVTATNPAGSVPIGYFTVAHSGGVSEKRFIQLFPGIPVLASA